ncbi:polysaccharide biosynthesis/export family protein [Rapidithrix thailandica]|uniref:Polysaccharide biosynthesis/export family protein n=1 Tax=Rapidithrix thailandica TaxID=413964 RepID=A0AAW9S3S6_9BACT
MDASRNYLIEEDDYLAISVYTNKGEALIDPNKEFETGKLGLSTDGNQQNQRSQSVNDVNSMYTQPLFRNGMPPQSHLVDGQGMVNLPMVGKLKLAGLTLKQAEELLTEAYEQHYEQPYVVMQYLNKRVTVMGALGDQVIPLRNEGMNLLEILALAGDFQELAKASNIRVLRGDLKNPSVQVVDLSSIESVKLASLTVLPGDVIYVEPRRKVDIAPLKDFAFVVSLITSVAALFILINK